MPTAVPVCRDSPDKTLSARSVSSPSRAVAVPPSVPRTIELARVDGGAVCSSAPSAPLSCSGSSTAGASTAWTGRMILTPSIQARRSCSFSRRLRTRVVDMVAVAALASAVTG